MTCKKTCFSYLIWGISSAVLCLAYVSLGINILTHYEAPVWFLTIPVAFVLLIYLCVKTYKNKMVPLQISRTFWVTMEALLFTLLFVGGFLARLYTATDISDTEMFKLCSISMQSFEANSAIQGLLDLYVLFFKIVFYYVGNSWIVAVAVQMNLQLLSYVILYFVVRKLSGPLAALVSYAFVLFSPMCITSSVTLDPTTFYFALFILVVYFVSESACRFTLYHKVKVYQYIAAVLIGLFAGVVIYYDLIGICAVVMALSLLGLSDFTEQSSKTKGKFAYFIVYLIFVLLGFVTMLFISCQFDVASFMAAFVAWERNFLPLLGEAIYLPLEINYGLRESIYTGVVFIVCLLGILGFWESKYKDSHFASAISTLVLMAIMFNCSAAQVVNRTHFLIILLAFLAGSSFRSLFDREVLLLSDEEEEYYDETDVFEQTESSEGELVDAIEETTIEEPVVESPEEPPVIHYIPNPLPLPKKHVKKTMNYGIDVDSQMMDYDIEISEDDDFDI